MLTKNDLWSIGLMTLFLMTVTTSCKIGEAYGKEMRAKWHCESQGYKTFQVTDRGTIECIKITREVVR